MVHLPQLPRPGSFPVRIQRGHPLRAPKQGKRGVGRMEERGEGSRQYLQMEWQGVVIFTASGKWGERVSFCVHVGHRQVNRVSDLSVSQGTWETADPPSGGEEGVGTTPTRMLSVTQTRGLPSSYCPFKSLFRNPPVTPSGKGGRFLWAPDASGECLSPCCGPSTVLA